MMVFEELEEASDIALGGAKAAVKVFEVARRQVVLDAAVAEPLSRTAKRRGDDRHLLEQGVPDLELLGRCGAFFK